MNLGKAARFLVAKCWMAAVIVLAAFAATPAMAQGTGGALPDPVSGGDLNKFLDRYLDLNPEQWMAVEKAHESYKEEFKRLRENEIQKFLDEMSKLQGRMPKRDELKAFLDKMDLLQGRIRGLDARLFSQIEISLEDSQRALMPRVRLARDRDIYQGALTRNMPGGSAFDLSEVYFATDMSPEERQATDPLIMSYENTLTNLAKRHYDATVNSFVTMFEAIEKSGVDTSWMEEFQDPEVMKDPERIKELQAKAMEFQKAMMAAMADAMKKSNELAADITKLHHTTDRGIEPLMKPETARRFKDAYYKKAYPRLRNADGGAARMFQAALKLHDLTPDERQTINDTFGAFQRQDDARVEEIVKAIDESQASRNPMGGFGEDFQKEQEKLNEMQTKRAEASTAAIEGLKSLLGPERSERLARVGTSEGMNDVILGIGDVMGSEVAGEVAVAVGQDSSTAPKPDDPAVATAQSYSGDQYVPSAMGPKDVAMIARELDLSPAQRTVLDSMHTDYISRYNALSDSMIKPLQEVQQKQWKKAADGTQEHVPLSESDIEKSFELRTKAREAIVDLDRNFFSEVASVFTEDGGESPLRLAQLHRASQWYSSSNLQMWRGPFDSGEERDVDPLQVVTSVQLDETSRYIVDQILLDNADELMDSMKTLSAIELTNQMESDKYYAKIEVMQKEDPESVMGSGFDWMEVSRKAAERSKEALAKRKSLNKEIFETIDAALSPAEAKKVIRAFNRQAYPDVFNDTKSAEKFLEQARALKDLSDSQVRALDAATKEFSEEYDRISAEMIKISMKQESPMEEGNDPERWKDYMKLQQEQAKHRFDRDEASAKAIRRIRSILSAEQAAFVPGLDKADQVKTNEWGFPD